MSVSLWQRLGSRDEFSCEVAIVGAGISGLSAAIECEALGLDAVVIESRAVGAGASGRNAGFLMRGAAENYAQAARAWGRGPARELWRWTERNLEDLVALGIDRLPSFERRPSCLVGSGPEEDAQLRESAAMLEADGFDARLIGPGDGAPEDAVWRRSGARLGLVNPGDAVCSPVELVGHLAGLLTRARVLAGVEVGAIEADDHGVTLTTSRGRVRAGRALVCTNAWAGRLIPGLARLVEPNRGQMLALRPVEPRDAQLACAYYLDHGSEYIRTGPPGTVVFGGARKHHAAAERCDSEGVTDAVQGELERMARVLFPGGFEVVARWAGVMGFSADGLPLVGPAAVERVWACAGFTGHGMSLAHRTARLAVRAMVGAGETPFPLARHEGV